MTLIDGGEALIDLSREFIRTRVLLSVDMRAVRAIAGTHR
jgi:hypothetical protein